MKNVLLVNATLTIVFLSDTYEGSAHDKRIADGRMTVGKAGGAIIRRTTPPYLCFRTMSANPLKWKAARYFIL